MNKAKVTITVEYEGEGIVQKVTKFLKDLESDKNVTVTEETVSVPEKVEPEIKEEPVNPPTIQRRTPPPQTESKESVPPSTRRRL